MKDLKDSVLHKQVEHWNVSDINYFLGYEEQAELDNMTLEDVVSELVSELDNNESGEQQ